MAILSKPILTVAIPTYNRLSDLKACLRSVEASCALVEDSIEICVSDNCSSDGTLAYLESYVSLIPSVRFNWKANAENIGGARNIRSMFSFCNGKYIYWLTDDDLMLPNALVIVIDIIKKYSPSYIRTAMIVNLIESRRAFYYGNTVTEKIQEGGMGFWRLLGLSHVLTGTVHLNNPETNEVINLTDSIHVCTDMFLYYLDNPISISDVCNIHVWENEVFWGDDINYMRDSGSERVAKQRKLNLDFQLIIYNSPVFKRLDKVKLARFLMGNYGFICDEIIRNCGLNIGFVTAALFGYSKFKINHLGRSVIGIVRRLGV